jgi:hypothetical protein
MDETTLNLIFGVIFLILIINTTMLFSLTPGVRFQDPAPPLLISPIFSPVPEVTNPVLTLPTPVINRAASVVQDTPLRISNPSPPVSYVTMEPMEPDECDLPPILQPVIPARSTEGYLTIYSIKNQSLFDKSPRFSFNLVNPPLVIEYNVTPYAFSDVKYVEYKTLATAQNANLVVKRHYEGTWVKVVVTEKATGQIITEDGYGHTYSDQTPRQIVLYENGNYLFDISGSYASVDLTVKVKKEGNIPV